MYGRLAGKHFSILGDSISTLEGFNPRGYRVFYSGDACEKSGVDQMQDTWWGNVISFFGGELLVNNSWSGSRVAQLPGNGQLFPSGCSDERTSFLHASGITPDVIIVYLGINDWANGVGVKRESGQLSALNEYFDSAYATMLGKLRSNYPKAEIWCCTLCETYMARRPDFQFPHKYGGIRIEKYNEVIRDTAKAFNCGVVDLYSFKTPYDSVDGSHPTNAGMGTLATMIIRSIVDREVLLMKRILRG